MEQPLLIFALFSLVFSVSSATQSLYGLNFLQCLSFHSRLDTQIKKLVYSPFNPLYSSVLQSSIKNLRFNSSSTPKPQFIITPESEFHVQAAVICSKRHGLQVRVRSGGHDYEGLSYTAKTPFVIIDLVNLRKVSVDLDTQTAWVQAGATLGELYYQIANKSSTLAFPAGVCTTIGVGGHISGGGQGTLMRKYGLAADNILDAILVDANGLVLDRESMGDDLFWAIRGGGGASFGVIISWKIKLVPVPPKVTVFTIPKTLEQGATQLIHRWQQIADEFDEDLFIRIIITVGKDSKGKRTVNALFNSLYLGSIEQLVPMMKASFPELGLEAENCMEMSWIESILYFDDGKPRGESIDVLMDRNHIHRGFFKAKSDFVYEPISENDLEDIWKVFQEGEAGVMIWDPYGGKMSEIPSFETPFPHRAGTLYNIQYFNKWWEEGIEAERKHLEWTDNIYNFMGRFVSKDPRTAYLNYRDLDLGMDKYYGANYLQAKTWGNMYFKNNFERLARVKGEVDPENFFRNEQSIPPLYPTLKRT